MVISKSIEWYNIIIDNFQKDSCADYWGKKGTTIFFPDFFFVYYNSHVIAKKTSLFSRSDLCHGIVFPQTFREIMHVIWWHYVGLQECYNQFICCDHLCVVRGRIALNCPIGVPSSCHQSYFKIILSYRPRILLILYFPLSTPAYSDSSPQYQYSPKIKCLKKWQVINYIPWKLIISCTLHQR